MSGAIDRFYDFEEIAKAGDCLAFATTHCGLSPVHGHADRFNCPWRPGSDSGAFAINRDGWCDHTKTKGDPEYSGGIIRFAELALGISLQEAQQVLGDYYRLEPKKRKIQTTATIETYLADGYRVVRVYEYRDLDGELRHAVTRLEHDTKPKQFIQSAPGQRNLKGVTRLLYRLPEWSNAAWVCICEGEKNADAVAALGIPATTNCGGAGNWEDSYDEFLAGKKIVLFEDNDDAGRARTASLLPRLHRVAAGVKVIRFPESEKGYDVADWIEDGHGRADLMAMITATPAYAGSELELAKAANEVAFANYLEQREGKKTTTAPRLIGDLLADCRTRFLGFPRRLGENLFDHDRDTGRIEFLHRPAELFSWAQRKSKHGIPWKRGDDGYVTKEELFEGLRQSATRYEGIHHVPDWPRRADVYYTHAPLVPATDGDGLLFWELVDRFFPATEADRNLIAALFCAPIYYERGIPRPLWVIDSEASQSGKTSLASLVASLYAHPPIEIKTKDLGRDTQEITKRFISSEGRQARIAFIDNVTGTLYSQELAAFVTLPHISGRASYGRGEESRPNNITWVVTANNAALDNDLAIRAFVIRLTRPPAYNPYWLSDIQNYIEENRLGIFSDIVGMLSRHRPFELPPVSRFPEFETKILQPCCRTEGSYADTMRSIIGARAEANVDEDVGKQVEDVIRGKLAILQADPDRDVVFIHSAVVERWIDGIKGMHGGVANYIRSLAREGHTPSIHPKTQIWPHHGPDRRRGVLWWHGDPRRNVDWVVKSTSDNRDQKVVASMFAGAK